VAILSYIECAQSRPVKTACSPEPLSPMRVVEALQDLVLASGTMGIMSCGQGGITNNENTHYEVHRGSKAALKRV